MTPMWISIITTVVLRVPIAYGIAFFTRSAEYPTGRPESTFISLLVSWSLGALLTAVAYRFGAWRKRLATAEPAPQHLRTHRPQVHLFVDLSLQLRLLQLQCSVRVNAHSRRKRPQIL